MAKPGYASTKLGTPIDKPKSNVPYGIGGQVNIDKNWGVRANYDQYKAENTASQKATTDVLTIGGIYRF